MKLFISMLSAIALAAVIGCSKQEEGTAEHAGKQVDEAVEKVESYTEEKVHEMGEAVEKAGEDLQK